MSVIRRTGRKATGELRALLRGGLCRADLELLRRVGREAADGGRAAWLVGGPVRDLLLGRPVRDLDVVVSAAVGELARGLARRLEGSVRLHSAFGTATVRLPDGRRLDLVRARKESYSGPARLPVVRPADIAHDLARRDFTVNAMALDLLPRRFGALLDPHGGRDDLERKAIRVLHERSMFDDPTRAFRAVRFAVRLGFRIDADTVRQIRAASAEGVFDGLSAARLRREIRLLLDEGRPVAAARGVERLGLWSSLDAGFAVDSASAGPVLRRLDGLLRRHGPSSELPGWAVILAWLCRDLAPAARRRVVDRLRPARAERRIVLDAAGESRAILASLGRRAQPRPSRVLRACRAAGPAAPWLAAAATSRSGVRRRLVRYATEWRDARPDISGNELLAAGVRPGPAIARGLQAALEAKLDGRAPTARRQLGVALRAARRA